MFFLICMTALLVIASLSLPLALMLLGLGAMSYFYTKPPSPKALPAPKTRSTKLLSHVVTK